MKIDRKPIQRLTIQQYFSLIKFRDKRNFEAHGYVNLKTQLLHEYLEKNKLNSVVVGISGGIDSAVVLALLSETKKLGQLKQIIPVCLPALDSDGVSNQKEVLEKAQRLCEKFEIKCQIHDISDTSEVTINKCYKKIDAVKSLLIPPGLYSKYKSL